ncbi:MAG: hypothetical protein HOV80_36165 [Polyangiaceae bacterium]|nr:hypothetical protein [Polyangiaceae bacterium]
MTFVRKFNGKTEAPNDTPIVATYTCAEHGEMDIVIRRAANGEAPDELACPVEDPGLVELAKTMTFANDQERTEFVTCAMPAAWTPSPDVGYRVKRFEVVRGGWEKPARPTYLDTRELGEGQSYDEFRKKRAAIWEEKRKADVMRFKREG